MNYGGNESVSLLSTVSGEIMQLKPRGDVMQTNVSEIENPSVP